MGQLSSHSIYVHLYVNGLYWGLYNPSERPDDAFLYSYDKLDDNPQSPDREDWDIVKDFNAELYTREKHWLPELDRVLNRIIPLSHELALERFRKAGLYPEIDPPEFNQYGGKADKGFRLEMNAPEGTLYYTLDGSDPRLAGGRISLNAEKSGNSGITLKKDTAVSARTYRDGKWSAIIKTDFMIK